MDDSPDRRSWLDKLLAFMEERRTPITTCPTISKNPLDLFRLYIYVKERGGFMEVVHIRFHDFIYIRSVICSGDEEQDMEGHRGHAGHRSLVFGRLHPEEALHEKPAGVRVPVRPGRN